jgi:tetratricopeptide (TPR) repeat protein
MRTPSIRHSQWGNVSAHRWPAPAEIDTTLAEAWNKLGVSLVELGDTEQAAGAFERALAANAAYPDTRYSLADLLDDKGHILGAAVHWRAYLAQDRQSQWATHARKCLATAQR